MEDNRAFLQKADLAISDLVNSGGYLVPAQAQRFMRLLIKPAKLLPICSVTPMASVKQQINKIRFGSRVLRAGNEGAALAAGDRSKPELSRVELDAKLFKGEVHLSNETIEDSIERAELRQTIMETLTEAISRDMEEAVINGDIQSTDLFLKQVDGILKQADTNKVDVADSTLSKGVFRDLLRVMPKEFLRDKSALRFFTSTNAEIGYRDALADRATVGGDRFLTESATVSYTGIPVVDVPLFPENIGTGTHCTSVILTDPKNIDVGIWRQIRLETDRDISAGVLKVVATIRFDVKFQHEPAVAKAYNVKVV